MRPRKRFADVKKNLEASRGGTIDQVSPKYSNPATRNRRDPRILDNVPIKKSYFAQRAGFIILLLTVLISFIYVIRLSDKPIIKFVGSKLNQRITDQTQSDLYSYAKKLIDSSLLNNNKITFNMSTIQASLLSNYPEFSDIKIDLPLIDSRPVITLIASDPIFILANTNGQYLINSRGAAIMQEDTKSNLSYLNLITINDQTGFNVELGKLALSDSDVSFIQEVVYQLRAKDYSVAKIVLPQSSREADVYIKNANYYIKFNLQSDTPKEQVGGFLATINYLRQKNISVSQYVDVRVENRVYYK